MPCCFKAPVRKEGQRIVTRFQLQDDIEVTCHSHSAGPTWVGASQLCR